MAFPFSFLPIYLLILIKDKRATCLVSHKIGHCNSSGCQSETKMLFAIYKRINRVAPDYVMISQTQCRSICEVNRYVYKIISN